MTADGVPSGGVCACCFVWEVTRGPHAGETLAFDALATPHVTLGVGRKSACWLRLRKDLEVSGLHAELQVAYDQTHATLSLRLRDADSTNGTRVNGQLLARGTFRPIADQDLLQFGRTTVRLRRGNTKCARARDDDPRHVEKTSQDGIRVDEPEHETEPADEPRREDHRDENVFEATPPRRSEATSSTLLATCMVCGQELAAWSVLEQQLHVNACLDRRTHGRGSRSTTVVPTTTASSTAGRKRKRQARLAKTPDEELAVALALSESLVDEEQQVDMQMALVRGELTQVDAQLKKLQKKRLALVKKLEKLEKTKRKVHKSEVVTPADVGVLMDKEMAMQVLFPDSRKVVEELDGERPRPMRSTVDALLKKYRSAEQEEMVVSYVTMWRRSAQWRGAEQEEMQEDKAEEDDLLYVNRLLRRLRKRNGLPMVQTTKMLDVTTTPVNEMEAMDTASNRENDGDNTDDVPGVVKRVFPNWAENLAFLKTQSLPDLKDALEQLRKMIPCHEVDQNMDSTTTESREDEPDAATNDEAIACAFFERKMLGLIAARECEITSNNNDVVVLVDSDDDGDQDNMEVECDIGTDEDGHLSDKCPSILSIDDSSSDEETANSNPSAQQSDKEELNTMDLRDPRLDSSRSEVEERTLAAPRNLMLLGDQAEETGVCPVAMPETMLSVPVDNTAPTQIAVRTAASQTTTEESSEARLERQLLSALKANAKLYESVLLLQPLELQQLLQYVRDDVGIKCAKTALVRFCDRHGITFKSS